MKYTIKRYTNKGTQEILAVNLSGQGAKFAVATNCALKFNSPKEASDYFKDAEIIGLVGCQVYIDGPKGGTYRINNGSYVK